MSCAEKNSVVNNGSENIRSSLLVENATPVGLVSFDSPLAGASSGMQLEFGFSVIIFVYA